MTWAWALLTATSLPPSSHLPSLLQSRPHPARTLRSHLPTHISSQLIEPNPCTAAGLEFLVSQFLWWCGETRIGLTEVSKEKDPHFPHIGTVGTTASDTRAVPRADPPSAQPFTPDQ